MAISFFLRGSKKIAGSFQSPELQRSYIWFVLHLQIVKLLQQWIGSKPRKNRVK